MLALNWGQRVVDEYFFFLADQAVWCPTSLSRSFLFNFVFFTHSQIKYRRTVVENLTENRNDCLNVRNQCSVTFEYEISREVHVYFAQYI